MSTNKTLARKRAKKAARRAARLRQRRQEAQQRKVPTKQDAIDYARTINCIQINGMFIPMDAISMVNRDGSVVDPSNNLIDLLDKQDEQSAILFDQKQNPQRYASSEIASLIETMNEARSVMNQLKASFQMTSDGTRKMEIKEQFNKIRGDYYHAIDTVALKTFGDFGVGGKFGKIVQKYLHQEFQVNRSNPNNKPSAEEWRAFHQGSTTKFH